ncbi:universal stress protein [Haloarcula nitratireducens]|uniref:Universal stress protein n=1 Tax=Haloarcula nitratireducens TaxID=2487749 RepID=A0AAW4P858_9EURY|nr:universal stress protein [Halomicroarcula nitratireducens]MBX0294107.1 universal stress protein [Halomicroarcula nitratireducens]
MALERILLAVGPNDKDRIDELAAAVTDIAGPAGASVVIAHVFTDDEYDNVVDRLEFASASEADPDEVADRHTTVRELEDRFSDAGIDYSVRGAVGNHGQQIVDLAEEENANLVVVGGRKRSPTGKAVFGSTAQEVMLNAPCPVTFVRGE